MLHKEQTIFAIISSSMLKSLILIQTLKYNIKTYLLDSPSNLFFLRFYLFIHERQRERERERVAETQPEGEAGSLQGAQGRTQSQGFRITP